MRRAGQVTLGVCCVWLVIAAPQCEGQPVEAERHLSPAKKSVIEKMERIRELRQQRQDAHQLRGGSSEPVSAYADTAAARNPFPKDEFKQMLMSPRRRQGTADVPGGVCARCHGAVCGGQPHHRH